MAAIKRIKVGTASCGIAAGAGQVFDALKNAATDVPVIGVGCFGHCYAEPIVEVECEDGTSVFYSKVKPEDAAGILNLTEEGRFSIPARRAELEKTLDQKKLSLKIKQIDPLPSDYRNILWKQFAAEQLQKRLHHESKVYRSLFHKQAVSELDYLRKQEEFDSADAEFKRIAADRKRVLKGLDKLYIRSAEMELELQQLKLAHRKKELALLEEERKYYKITAPYDGYCITNSDTVHGYDAVGTSAVSVHKDHKKIIYAYFDEDHINLIHEGMKGSFRSSQHGLKYGYFPVTVTEVKRGRTVTADRNIFLVKFRIDKEIVPLRIESAGRVELVLQ